jgi:hypothetical protein
MALTVPARAADVKKAAAKVEAELPAPSVSPAELAEKKMSELKELVRRSHSRASIAAAISQKNASGLTVEEEARLFGKAPEAPPPPPDPSKIDFSRAWPTYLSEAERRRFQEDLRDKKLRFELRRRLASISREASLEEKEAAGLMTMLLNEAEKKAGDTDKEPGSIKPLAPEDAFGLDPDDVKALEKR